MSSLVVGLDLGTSLCKASAFELDGTAVASAQKAITTYRPHPGWAEQEPREWVEAILEVLACLATDLGGRVSDIEVIGLSSHGPCVITTDDNFRPLGRCTIWQDQRATILIDNLIEKAGDDWIGLGTPETSFAVQLYWIILNNPALLQHAVHLLDSKGYLLSVLTGRVVDEPSSSPSGEDANRSLFDALGVDIGLLPKSTTSLSVVGTLVPKIQAHTNLPPGVKVVAGLNDGAAATLGAGVVKLGQGIVSLSTNGVMRTTVPHRLRGSTLHQKSMFCYPYVNHMYVTGGMTKSGADSVRWMAETFYRGREDDPSVFESMANEAMQSTIGANGVHFMPYLLGMGTPSPTKSPQGAFLNLGRHHSRPDLTRAVLEGLAFALKDIAETFDELGLSWEKLRFTGGGSKNPAWRQIVADILGKPLSGSRADSVLGAAIVAATGVGLFRDIEHAVQAMVTTTFQVEPVKKHTEAYESVYARFKKLKMILNMINDEQS